MTQGNKTADEARAQVLADWDEAIQVDVIVNARIPRRASDEAAAGLCPVCKNPRHAKTVWYCMS